MDEIRCQSGQRCVAATPGGAALVHRPTLCHGCIQSIQAKYDELPLILAVLPAWKGGLRGASGEAKVSTGKGEAPAPLNVGVVDLEIDVEDILEAVGGLRIVDLVNQEDGIRWAFRIRKAWMQADGFIGISRHWSPRHAPCPDCDTRTLGSYAGDNIVTCSSCAKTLTRDEYSRLCLVK